MKISVFITQIYLVVSCSASVYDEADVSAALKSKRNTFTNKPGLFTAILQEVDKQGINELPWWWITINGTTLSNPQDRESLGKLSSLFTEREVYIGLSITAEFGSAMANIINNVPHMEEMDRIKVNTDCLIAYFTVNHERQHNDVVLYGYYTSSSSRISTLTEFIEELDYDGEIGEIQLRNIKQSELSEAEVLDQTWAKLRLTEVSLLDGTLPSVVFSETLSSGDVRLPWRMLYLGDNAVQSLTDRATIDRMRKNGVLSDDCEVSGWNAGKLTIVTIPWIHSQNVHDWSKLF